MPQRTNPFQRLVTLLIAALGERAKIVESAMVPDRGTGRKREVDVYITTSAASHELKIAVEIISWARCADVSWVERMWAKHQDLRTNKLILVSERGFSPQALEKAVFYGVETLTIEEALATDWALIAKLEDRGVFEVVTLNFDVSAICKFEGGEFEELPVPLASSVSNPTASTTIGELVRSWLNLEEVRSIIASNTRGPQEHQFWLSYTEPDGLWSAKVGERSCQIMELRIGMRVVKSESPVRFATGKFKSTPFISGTSEGDGPALQFVLMKRTDESAEGYLVDAVGLRKLATFPHSEQNQLYGPKVPI